MAASGEQEKDGVSEAAASILSGLPDGMTAQQLFGDAGAMKALSERLAAQINSSLIPVESYPPEVRRRIKALKRLQFQTQELEAEFYLEVQKLEAKYQKLYQPLYNTRRDFITGSRDPTDEEAHWSEDDDEDASADEKKEGGKVDGAEGGEASKTSGVNQFWLIALKNCEIFADVIKEHDEPLLTHLTDIKVVYTDDKGLDFNLEFHFSDNEYFSNKILVKSYKVSCELNKDDPWSFEGAAITSSEGCKIDWKKGKDLTIKTVKKKQKNKGKGGQARTITKTVPNETFFNMFSEPKSAEPDSDELAAILSDDYTRAEFLRDRLVPKAVLFFTGEALEEDEEDFEEDYASSDDDGGDQGDDYDAQNDVNKAKPPECKQQ